MARDILRQIQTPYVDAQTLLHLLGSYRKPRECILRMVKNNELIRLKNGFYLIAEKIEKGVPYEQAANLLYGPSYVSLEWALSFYGMIPERVHTVTSMTLGRNKNFVTPVGNFSYRSLSPKCYPIGITQKQSVESIGNFLIATPEKALADLVFVSCRTLEGESLFQELVESKRMDEEQLQQLDKPLLRAIAASYRSKSVTHLSNLIGA